MDFFPDGGHSKSKGCEKLIEIKEKNNEEGQHRFKRFLFKNNHKQENNDDDKPRKSFLEKIRDQIGKLSPLKKVFHNIHAYIGCNHLRSPHYFISSINQCDFRAKLCSSWKDYLSKKCKDPTDNDLTYPRMGFYADKSDSVYIHGDSNFYLTTTSEKPYCSSSISTRSEKLPDKQTTSKSILKKALKKFLPKKKN